MIKLSVLPPSRVEKPLALNAQQARTLAELAAAQKLFCAEALWTLFLPKFDVIPRFSIKGCSGTCTRCSPITASTSQLITESCATIWPAARCSIWVPTLSPSPAGSSVSRK
jgi:hypothetical protein